MIGSGYPNGKSWFASIACPDRVHMLNGVAHLWDMQLVIIGNAVGITRLAQPIIRSLSRPLNHIHIDP